MRQPAECPSRRAGSAAPPGQADVGLDLPSLDLDAVRLQGALDVVERLGLARAAGLALELRWCGRAPSGGWRRRRRPAWTRLDRDTPRAPSRDHLVAKMPHDAANPGGCQRPPGTAHFRRIGAYSPGKLTGLFTPDIMQTSVFKDVWRNCTGIARYIMSHSMQDTPSVARVYCPGCEPEADPTAEILDLRWCEPAFASARRRRRHRRHCGRVPSGSAEAGGDDNRAWCALFHRRN